MQFSVIKKGDVSARDVIKCEVCGLEAFRYSFFADKGWHRCVVSPVGTPTPTKENILFKSGAASSKIPRYDLIPRIALTKLSDRFEKGVEKHKERAWNARSQNQECLTDLEFVVARAAHAIDHASKLIEKLTGVLPDDGDDDAGAIIWAGACLCAAVEALKAKRDATN